MKRIHYLLLGLLVSLTIAAVSPTLPPTRIAPGSGVTVTTNGVNSFTISASGGGGGATNGIQMQDGLGTNTTIYGLTINTGSTNNSLTASRAMVTDANKGVISSATTATELGYVSGVTSALQTQMDAKAPLASPTFTGTATSPALVLSSETASTIASFDGSKNVKSLATATYPSLTELSYVKGVTSALQTQINALGGGGGILTSNGLGTNLTVYSSAGGTTNWPLRIIGTNGGSAYFDQNMTLYLPQPSPGNTPVIKFPSSGWGLYDSFGGSGGVFFSSTAFTDEVAFSTAGVLISDGTVYGWSAFPNSVAMNTAIRRFGANDIEFDSGTTGIANRGRIRAATYTGRAGTSTSPFNAGGVIWVDTTTTGNITTGNDTILTNNFGANVFGANGDAVDFTVGGNFGNSINTRSVRLYIAGQTVFDSGGTVLTSGDAGWTLVSNITRTSSTALQVNTRLIPDYPLTGSSPFVQNAAITVGLTTNNPFLLTGEGVATGDVTRYIGRAEFKPAP